jgi:D-alanyl-D-alanine carboxypeptidase
VQFGVRPTVSGWEGDTSMPQFLGFAPASRRAEAALARFERVLQDLVEPLGNLGALVAIDVPEVGRVTFTAGHSNLDKSRAAQPGDVFRIASQTKTVTAMVLLLMARDGQVGLDEPVVTYLDLPIDRRITVRHLLMNRSGLGEYTRVLGPHLYSRVPFAPRDIVALALPQGQLFEPGAHFDYCNTGFTIAGMLIEAVSGGSFAEACAARITRPLGLGHTAFGGRMPAEEPMRGYVTLPPEAEPVDMTASVSRAFGSGDGLANADDLLVLYGSLLREESPLRISLHDLTAETGKPSANPHFAMSLGTEYGLGLERRAWAGREVWGHPGSSGHTRSSTWIDPGLGIGVTTCVTMHITPSWSADDIRYPRAQLFGQALSTAYALAEI